MRGYFGVGVINIKTEFNYHTLFRTANSLGAKFLFLIGARFKKRSADTLQSHKHIPLYQYAYFNDFADNMPYGCQLVGVEICNEAKPIKTFIHPERACYLLGPEDGSIPSKILNKCQSIISLPGERCFNVAVAGSIVLFDRVNKQ